MTAACAAVEVGAATIGTGCDVPGNIGKNRIGQVRTAQICSLKIRIAQVRALQGRGGQVPAIEIRLGEESFGQVRTGQIRAL